jgi:hypothetical protein
MRSFFLRVFVSFFFIGLLFYLIRDDVPQIIHALRHIDRGLLSAGFLVSILTVFVLSKRLQMIFAAEDVSLGFSASCNLTFVGYFFNNFLPTSIGGDIVKVLCASRITREPMKSLTSVLMDRVFGLFTFIVIPSVSLLFFLKEIGNPRVPLIIYSCLGGAFLFFLLLFNRNIARRFGFIETFLNYFRLGEKARRIYDGMHNFKNHKKVVLEAMLLSLMGQSASIFSLYLFSLALGAGAHIIYFYLLVPVVQLLSMLPSLNGLGIREGAYVYFLTPYVGRENAVAIGLLYLGVLLTFSVIGGIIYLIRHDYHIRFKEAAATP